MPLVYIPEETKLLIDQNRALVKEDYLIIGMFLDSAVRGKLRRLGVKTGQDLIVGHIKKLQKSRASHVDKITLKRQLKRHQERMRSAVRRLDEIV